jgi:hypothetical protein
MQLTVASKESNADSVTTNRSSMSRFGGVVDVDEQRAGGAARLEPEQRPSSVLPS